MSGSKTEDSCLEIQMVDYANLGGVDMSPVVISVNCQTSDDG